VRPSPGRFATDDDIIQDDDHEDTDVEAALDETLAAWLAPASTIDGDDDEDADEPDDGTPGDGGLAEVVPLRRPDEFLCRACFLLKHTSQLVDPARSLCRDCA